MYRDIKQSELKIHKNLGYVYFLDKKHPLATGNAGFVYYHRHVKSIQLGRWLQSSEEVHHIDGVKNNNNISNLQLCESKLDHIKEHVTLLPRIRCKHCNKEFKASKINSKFCSSKCFGSYNRKSNISKEDLELLIWTTPYTKIAEKLNMSDTGVKKLAKTLKCILPPSRFHNKKLSKEERLELYKEASIVQ